MVKINIIYAILFFTLNCGDSHNQSFEDLTMPEDTANLLKPTIINKQIVLAYTTTASVNQGKLLYLEIIDDTTFVVIDSMNCSFGVNGLIDESKKREGDKKTPKGVYKIGSAFGYSDDLNCGINFITLSDKHYWISDSGSDKYNQLVDYYPINLEAEKMRRTDHLYKYGIIIEYNTEKTQKGKGSAIFIHIERSPGKGTAGCIAISEEKLKKLIEWLRPEKNPVIFIGTKMDANIKAFIKS